MCFAEQAGLSPVLKESIELAARRAAASLFQHLGPAAEKARSRNRVIIRLTRRSHLSVDRSRSPEEKLVVTSQTLACKASEGDCSAALQLSGSFRIMPANKNDAATYRQIIMQIPYNLV